VEVENCSWLSDSPKLLHKNLSSILSSRRFLDRISLTFYRLSVCLLLPLQCHAGVAQSLTLLAFFFPEIYHKRFVLKFPFSCVRDLVACTDLLLI